MAESNNLKWYVLRAISGKENKVKEYIEGALVTSPIFREYISQVLIPTEKVVALKNGKRTIKERNMLPGYVLVECDLQDECYPLLRNIPNVLGFLSDGGKNNIKPAPVPQTEINKIIGAANESEREVISEENYLVGEKVKVTNGAFNGFNGVVSEVLQDKHKLKVIVTIFDRQTPLELGFNDVEKE
ncbi:MAG: transcription termination/antitermination protein NusG [Paludibacteraceae bacterium]|nr:transcription termination/antitermination protein NusG [Paludibacteraceae bacterium]